MPASRPVPIHAPHGWPLPPQLGRGWMQRRAVWWLRLLRAGRVHRFQADMRAVLASRRPPVRPLQEYGQALRAEWRARIERGPAGPALARAAHQNYLGDQGVVRGLVDGYIALLIARAGGAVPHGACEEETLRLVRVFCGLDPDYAVIGGWNTRGLLGDAVIQRCPLPAKLLEDAGLDMVLGEMLGAVGLAVLRVLRAAETGRIGADAALKRLSGLAAWTAALLLGRDAGDTLDSLIADLPELGQGATR